MNYDSVISSPIISEKSNSAVASMNQYTFRVAKNASKGLIRSTIEKMFNVKVLDVNTINLAPKSKRSWSGKRSQFQSQVWKKALVTLEKKNTISLFTGGDK